VEAIELKVFRFRVSEESIINCVAFFVPFFCLHFILPSLGFFVFVSVSIFVNIMHVP